MTTSDRLRTASEGVIRLLSCSDRRYHPLPTLPFLEVGPITPQPIDRRAPTSRCKATLSVRPQAAESAMGKR